jgi:molybdenum cofactor biosynthesis protein MoaC
MVDITQKSSSLRKAIAQAILKVSHPDTIAAVVNRTVPKGDVLEMAKTAGLFAAKRTADMIPDCHPLHIDFTSIKYEIGEMEIIILAEIHTIYKTGVEVEAMHAASVVALTMYDMLKPIDKGISIEKISLVEKIGGKTDFKKDISLTLKAAVIVCSDSISAGQNEDKAGKSILEKLKNWNVEVPVYQVIPDEISIIQSTAKELVNQGINLIIFAGGTGLSPRDVTPEALIPILDKQIPGIEETIRNYGQLRTPYAMLSRSVAGMIGDSLVLGIPGSTKGATESIDAVFPAALHIFKVLEGQRHE